MSDDQSAPEAPNEEAMLAELQRQMAAIMQRKSAAIAVATAQAVTNSAVPLAEGEWEYTVKVGDILRFPASVHKVDK